MTYYVHPAQLNHWEAIKGVAARLRDSRFSAFVGGEEAELEGFLVNSLTVPQAVGLLLLTMGDTPIGLAALIIVDCPKPGRLGTQVQVERHGFIHSVYIDPFFPDGSKVPGEAGQAMLLGVEQWCRARGAVYLYGNVRLDGRFGALWRKFGLSPQFGTVGKAIPSTQLEELPGFELVHVVVGKELGNGQR